MMSRWELQHKEADKALIAWVGIAAMVVALLGMILAPRFSPFFWAAMVLAGTGAVACLVYFLAIARLRRQFRSAP
jgi:cyanate permease